MIRFFFRFDVVMTIIVKRSRGKAFARLIKKKKKYIYTEWESNDGHRSKGRPKRRWWDNLSAFQLD